MVIAGSRTGRARMCGLYRSGIQQRALSTTPIDPDDSGREQWFVAATILQPPRRRTQRSAHDGLSHSAAAGGSPSAHLSAVVRSRCRIRDGGGTALVPRRPFGSGDVARPGRHPSAASLA